MGDGDDCESCLSRNPDVQPTQRDGLLEYIVVSGDGNGKLRPGHIESSTILYFNIQYASSAGTGIYYQIYFGRDIVYITTRYVFSAALEACVYLNVLEVMPVDGNTSTYTGHRLKRRGFHDFFGDILWATK